MPDADPNASPNQESLKHVALLKYDTNFNASTSVTNVLKRLLETYEMEKLEKHEVHKKGHEMLFFRFDL